MEISNAVLKGQTITIGGIVYPLSQLQKLLDMISNSNTIITNAIFKGNYITIGDVRFSTDRIVQILTDTTAWNENVSYMSGSFVSYQNKWYISLQDNNTNHLPTNDDYWKRYMDALTPQTISTSTTLEYNKEYIVTALNNITLTLPQAKEKERIKISAQFLNEKQIITIIPHTGNTIYTGNELNLDISYSSVELICIGTDWKIVTPFAPMTNTKPQEAVADISNSDTLSLLQDGVWKTMTLNQLKTFLGLTS